MSKNITLVIIYHHHKRLDLINHELMATVKASHERINTLMDVSLQTTEACLEKIEVNWEKIRNQDGSMSGRGGSGTIRAWGLAISHMVLSTAEETDPGQWWIRAEAGCCPKMVDLPCHSCIAQGIQSSGTRQR
jgi:hypothetical protein